MREHASKLTSLCSVSLGRKMALAHRRVIAEGKRRRKGDSRAEEDEATRSMVTSEVGRKVELKTGAAYEKREGLSAVPLRVLRCVEKRSEGSVDLDRRALLLLSLDHDTMPSPSKRRRTESQQSTLDDASVDTAAVEAPAPPSLDLLPPSPEQELTEDDIAAWNAFCEEYYDSECSLSLCSRSSRQLRRVPSCRTASSRAQTEFPPRP